MEQRRRRRPQSAPSPASDHDSSSLAAAPGRQEGTMRARGGRHLSTPPPSTPGDRPEYKQLMERPSPSGHVIDEVTYPTPIPQPSWSLDDLPTKVACTLAQGSNVTSMDFHPFHHTLLLVGSANGEFTLWEIGMRERLVSKPFKIWNMQACSAQFQCVVSKDPSIAISRVTWSPDGDLIGVAFTKHLIHLHAYQHPNETRQIVEIEAHSGGVNDIAFSQPNKQLCVVTCGDDKLIRVWDMHGQKIYSFEGHEASVYSICPHHMECIQFIFSTSIDGKIKAWLYDNSGARVASDAPGKWCTTMLYSANGTRLFSCGTSREGESHLVEWNHNDVSIKRTYSGFRKKPSGVVQGVVQFDTAQNRILAAGEDNQIKFWDVDSTSMLTCIEADGGLPSLPRIRFNKEGNLLAVTTVGNGFKILANADGLRSLPAFGNQPFEVFKLPYEASAMKVSGAPVVAGISSNIGRMDHLDRNSPVKLSPIMNGGDPTSRSMDMKPIISKEKLDKGKPWELIEGLNAERFCVATMPETPYRASKISKVLNDDDLLREIIIRISLPATLVRAALVCKRWYHLASEPAFLRWFRECHPPCLLGFFLEDQEDSNAAPFRFFPMLPQPPELAAAVHRVASYSLDYYRGAPANLLCSRKGRVLISLYNQVDRNKFAIGVHSPLCHERGQSVIPSFPHVQIQDDYSHRMSDLLVVEEADGLSYLHLLVDSNMQRTKSMVHVHMLRHSEGVWRTYLTLETDQLLDPRREPKVLANSKIYIPSAQSDILVLDLTASSICTVQLPQGVEYGDKDTMLSLADEASGVYLIHTKKLQLHIWLYKGDNWLVVDTICLLEMFANLRMSGCMVEDESTAPLRINHVGDYAEFVFLEKGRYALHLDIKYKQIRKVYDTTKEDRRFGTIHPFMMIWPPSFPALKDDHTRNAM
ncbi:hypothetical protein CFC21_106080 [Triticum aestivum]|uniref:Uncharacterized protein n=2 Tax=Triticum aestivum TaxID=4565 RepID=A0A3B6SVF7_WHEAT|nr:hypothetical protein CFC21_106080 [Triticum aestivum]